MSARVAKKRPSPQIHNALRVRTSNIIVMVPDTDWASVLAGDKRMFRSYSRRLTPSLMPTPCIAYRYRLNDHLETAPLWLEDTWQEPLGSITSDGLRDEGFTTLADFRSYFDTRYPKGGYRPLAPVQVYRVRPILAGDLEEYGQRLVAKLGYT